MRGIDIIDTILQLIVENFEKNIFQPISLHF